MVRAVAIGVTLTLMGLCVLTFAHSASRNVEPRTAILAAPAPERPAVRPVRVIYPSSASPVVPARPEAEDLRNPPLPPARLEPVSVAHDEPSPAAAEVHNGPSPLPETDPNLPTSRSPEHTADRIDINSATLDALDHISGGGRIGRAIARHRPYRSIEDLVRKRVVRRDVYERIRAQLAAN